MQIVDNRMNNEKYRIFTISDSQKGLLYAKQKSLLRPLFNYIQIVAKFHQKKRKLKNNG